MNGTLSFYLYGYIEHILPIFFIGTILCFIVAISLAADGYFDHTKDKYHPGKNHRRTKKHTIVTLKIIEEQKGNII
jgi:hypothetical protein